jgi:monofunctional glycosyltransferase
LPIGRAAVNLQHGKPEANIMQDDDAVRLPQRSGLMRRIFRNLLRLSFYATMALACLIVLFRFVPPPSTLILGRWLTLQPVAREWVPLEAIAPALVKAVVAAEDQRFCSHSGIDWVELQKVLDDDDTPQRGASTLTMQTVKNVFLWPGRSVIRKALELPLAVITDMAWGKRRVMEIYLNVAEWGDGVFGAEAAARRYFGKSASALLPLEAARLAASLPNPALRNPGAPTAGLRAITRRVLERMEGAGELASCVFR